ncbi:transposase [Dietzia sp. CQ4]|nr:transposase [Dietzia sp. CQ4]
MAPRSRRKFSPQFEAEAVQLVIQSDRSIAKVAGELEINPGTLGNWVQRHRQDNPEPEPGSPPPRRSPRSCCLGRPPRLGSTDGHRRAPRRNRIPPDSWPASCAI